MNYHLSNFQPDEIAARFHEVISVYREAFAQAPYFKREDEVDEFAASLQSDLHEMDLRFIAASDTINDPIIGFAYGRRVRQEHQWDQIVSQHLDENQRLRWMADAYQLVQIAVLPEFQDLGIGGAIHDRLFEGSPYNRAVLTTISAECPAQRLYQGRDWTILADGIQVPGIPRLYCLMGLELEPFPSG